MGRRANYGWEKRQRELKKQKKKEAKAEKKRLAREAAVGEAEGDGASNGEGEPIEAADEDQVGEGDPGEGDLPEDESGGNLAVPEDQGGPP